MCLLSKAVESLFKLLPLLLLKTSEPNEHASGPGVPFFPFFARDPLTFLARSSFWYI